MAVGVKYIGKYNVDYCGNAWSGKTKFDMVIISEFDSDDKEIARKTLCFLCGNGLVTPEFKTEAEVAQYFNKYPNNTRLKAYKGIVTERI